MHESIIWTLFMYYGIFAFFGTVVVVAFGAIITVRGWHLDKQLRKDWLAHLEREREVAADEIRRDMDRNGDTKPQLYPGLGYTLRDEVARQRKVREGQRMLEAIEEARNDFE